MGEGLIYFYKNKIRKEHKLSFVITFIFTLLIHAYKFANYLPIADSLHFNYSSSDIIQSGRWFLSIACSISSYFDLPWVLGILSCIYIAVTTVIIVSLFKVKNPIIIILISGLFASSTCTTDTIMYLYTADGYFLSMLLATLAVYLTRIEKKRIFPKLIAIILLCLSCGIYQAYITYALILVICQLIMLVLEEKYSVKEIILWLLQQLLIYITALIMYYVIWQFLLDLKKTTADDYLGISSVGSFGIDYINHGLYNTYHTFMNYFLLIDINDIGIVPHNFLNFIFLVIAIITLLISLIKQKLFKKPLRLLIYILSIILIIPLSSMWHFTSLNLFSFSYLPKMLQCFTVLYILVILLGDKYTSKLFKNSIAILITIICFYNSIVANITYFYLEKTYIRTMDDASNLMSKINELKTNDEEMTKILILGDLRYKYHYVDTKDNTDKYYKYSILMKPMDHNLLVDSYSIFIFLRNTYDADLFLVSDKENYINKVEVKEMGIWPSKDSVKLVDDVIVIKLSQ